MMLYQWAENASRAWVINGAFIDSFRFNQVRKSGSPVVAERLYSIERETDLKLVDIIFEIAASLNYALNRIAHEHEAQHQQVVIRAAKRYRSEICVYISVGCEDR